MDGSGPEQATGPKIPCRWTNTTMSSRGVVFVVLSHKRPGRRALDMENANGDYATASTPRASPWNSSQESFSSRRICETRPGET